MIDPRFIGAKLQGREIKNIRNVQHLFEDIFGSYLCALNILNIPYFF